MDIKFIFLCIITFFGSPLTIKLYLMSLILYRILFRGMYLWVKFVEGMMDESTLDTLIRTLQIFKPFFTKLKNMEHELKETIDEELREETFKPLPNEGFDSKKLDGEILTTL